MVSRPTQKSSPAPRRTTISALSPALSRSLANSTAMASEAALPISGRLRVISSTGPLRAVRIWSAIYSSPNLALSRGLSPECLNRAPDPLRGDRHVHVLDAIVLERVNDGVDHHRERRRVAALAAGAHAERIVGRMHLADLGQEGEEIVR